MTPTSILHLWFFSVVLGVLAVLVTKRHIDLFVCNNDDDDDDDAIKHSSPSARCVSTNNVRKAATDFSKSYCTPVSPVNILRESPAAQRLI